MEKVFLIRLLVNLVFALAFVVVPGSLWADTVSYTNIGNEATPSTFRAANTGSITAYFYDASSAYTSVIGMSVNGGPVKLWGLNNHSSEYGDALVLGSVKAGDAITFSLFVTNTDEEWSSDVSRNTDNFSHSFAADFAGDSMIPVGTYIGFEDLYGGGDKDYNDVQFVFANTGFSRIANLPAPIPEPGALSLCGMGIAAIMSLRRKWKKIA